MSETIIDSETVKEGETAVGSFGKRNGYDSVLLLIDGDENAENLDIEVSGVARQVSGKFHGLHDPPSIEGLAPADHDSNSCYVRFDGLRALGHVQLTVTNNSDDDAELTIILED